MTTAFELSKPEHRGRYEVTVYQMGWRLGGKGRSGRGVADRIEEHGLHLWMGFYDNAFRVMRETYEELGRDPAKCRIATWRDAFTPDPYCGIADHTPDGRWLPWTAQFPPLPGLPGDPQPPGQAASIGDYLARTISLVGTLLDAIRAKDVHPPDTRSAEDPPGANEDLASRIGRLLRFGEFATVTALLEGVRLLEMVVRAPGIVPDELALPFLDGISRGASQYLESRVQGDPEMRRLWEIIDLVFAVVRGSLRTGLLTSPRGFDVLDEWDCREWLLMHGASKRAIDSAFVRALYDLAFAYEDGDTNRPRVAAGQALRGAVRAFFGYRGSFFWKMQSGMGDIVFAPMYEVLQRRGVRFEFFHRLTNVGMAEPDGPAERPYVQNLEFDVQAHVRDANYEPLVDVRGLPCWPAAPLWDQLVDGDQLARAGIDLESTTARDAVETRRLEVGRDFDLVVLGVSVAAIPHVASEILARDPRWRTMVDRVKTVSTQAFQLWLETPMREVGWEAPEINLSGFVEPFDTWADMTHLVPEESWPRDPGAIAYFCSVLPDEASGGVPQDREVRQEEVRAAAIRFLDHDIVHLWPKATRGPGEFRWDLLASPDGSPADAGAGSERFATQFWTANTDPTDRYVLSLPGSLAHRISPLDDTYDNLTIAGDWTDCGFNEGCVEAAVMSGLLAAHALSLRPGLEEIVGYDHP